ncbi:unnamed protein product (macronuclear) [Paramecium tetraurelia]|uniref:Uncharacterized protein n=1 Tax=Paramecium tetraurelia TaxID=5888 RepID=A0DCK0_PARTE|nr:uncharacterized protein GSPATT00015645001 [Paramecium tetraurelia]CAK80767.1 unnamed protein product [Paramecium tetraurelia]|eukprot:XP_001448164.1 hypothetical protein (macronuclear) [Paramecium tetraurelia strain d4-2]
MKQYKISSMTILLHQHNIERVVQKIEHNCYERNSVKQKSEQVDSDFFFSKPTQKQNGHQSHRQPMSARSLYFTPMKSAKSHRQMQQQKEVNHFEDGIESIDGDQSNLLTVILQLQEQIKQQKEQIEKLNEKCTILEAEKDEAQKPNIEQITITAHLLQQNEQLMQQLARLKKKQ